MRKIRREFPNVGFAWESATGFSYEKAFLKQSDDPSTLEHGGHGGVLGQSDLYKVLIRVPHLSGQEFQHSIAELVGDVFEASTSGAPFLDATAHNINKATGLETAAQHFGVHSAEVIAFGDNLNDIPMLNWAGTAVAMGNAHPDVLQIADAMTVSNMRDGHCRLFGQVREFLSDYSKNFKSTIVLIFIATYAQQSANSGQCFYMEFARPLRFLARRVCRAASARHQGHQHLV
jgi:hydroxymethylpyrimidine pyrophosphatase-like HAD family hydrolase